MDKVAYGVGTSGGSGGCGHVGVGDGNGGAWYGNFVLFSNHLFK